MAADCHLMAADCGLSRCTQVVDSDGSETEAISASLRQQLLAAQRELASVETEREEQQRRRWQQQQQAEAAAPSAAAAAEVARAESAKLEAAKQRMRAAQLSVSVYGQVCLLGSDD